MESANRFKKRSKVIGFIGAILILGSVVFIVAENPFALDKVKRQNILYYGLSPIFAIPPIIAIYRYYKGKKITAETKITVSKGFALVLTALLFDETLSEFSTMLFWLSLVSWVLSFVFISQSEQRLSLKNGKLEDYFNFFILLLSSVWAILITFMTIGATIFKYSTSAINSLNIIHPFLDFRFNIALIIGLLIFTKSAVFVIQDYETTVQSPLKPSGQQSYANPFLHSLYISLNLGINFLISTYNIFYRGIVIVGRYVYRIGGEIWSSLKTLIRKSVVLVLYSLIMFFTILGFYTLHKLSTPLLEYIIANDWIDSYKPFLWITLYTVLLGLCLIVIHFFALTKYVESENRFKRNEELFNNSLSRNLSFLPYIVIPTLVIGVIFSAFSYFWLPMETFRIFGIYSAILGGLIIISFTLHLISNFSKNSTPSSK